MEKDGSISVEANKLALFRQFLDDGDLMDLDLKGCKFTWISNPRNGIITRDKLDRVLVNWAYREIFSHAISIALPIVNSDHSIIVLKSKSSSSSGVSFKYEAFWEDHEECREILLIDGLI